MTLSGKDRRIPQNQQTTTNAAGNNQNLAPTTAMHREPLTGATDNQQPPPPPRCQPKPNNMPLTAEHQHGVSISKRKREGQRETEAETREREANILRTTIQMQCRTSETLGRGIKRCEPVRQENKGAGCETHSEETARHGDRWGSATMGLREQERRQGSCILRGKKGESARERDTHKAKRRRRRIAALGRCFRSSSPPLTLLTLDGTYTHTHTHSLSLSQS